MSGTLTHGPSSVIQQLLVDLGLGIIPTVATINDDWQIHTKAEPDKPDNLITIYNTTPRVHGRIQYDGEVAEHHGLMIRIRGTASTAETKALAIKDAIAKSVSRDNVTVDSSTYLVQAISRISGPIELGEVEHSSRFAYSINAVADLIQTA